MMELNNKEISTIKKTFGGIPSDYEDTNIKLSEYKGFMECANVLMLIPKTQKAKQSIRALTTAEEQKVPNLDTSKYKFCRFSREYLLLILKLLTATKEQESISIGVCDGMPLIIEHEHLGFILAPRYNNDVDSWDDSKIKEYMKGGLE